jgi:hypothetical protein
MNCRTHREEPLGESWQHALIQRGLPRSGKFRLHRPTAIDLLETRRRRRCLPAAQRRILIAQTEGVAPWPVNIRAAVARTLITNGTVRTSVASSAPTARAKAP